MLLLFGQVRESSRRRCNDTNLPQGTCYVDQVVMGVGRGAMAKAMMSPTFIAQLCILLATKTCVMHD